MPLGDEACGQQPVDTFFLRSTFSEGPSRNAQVASTRACFASQTTTSAWDPPRPVPAPHYLRLICDISLLPASYLNTHTPQTGSCKGCFWVRNKQANKHVHLQSSFLFIFMGDCAGNAPLSPTARWSRLTLPSHPQCFDSSLQ